MTALGYAQILILQSSVPIKTAHTKLNFYAFKKGSKLQSQKSSISLQLINVPQIAKNSNETHARLNVFAL